MANLTGTAGNDTLTGDDIDFFGNGGSDTIHGGGGNDTIDGRGGTNALFGDEGNDVIKYGVTTVPSIAPNSTGGRWERLRYTGPERLDAPAEHRR